jgi:hypothetical protein
LTLVNIAKISLYRQRTVLHLVFPYLWQQTEYVLGGGSSHYMFLVLAAEKLLNNGS